MAPRHDDLFRAIFARPEHAQALLAGFLPPEIAAAIDWSTLELVTGSFLDEQSRAQQADLLFSACIAGKRVLLYLLFEHKSSLDRWAALQLLGYVVQIWRNWHRDHPGEELPEVIPIVVHHGPRPWQGPTSIDELVERTGFSRSARRRLARFRPRFGFLLVDLSRLAEEEIAARVPAPATRLVLFVLRVRMDAGFDDAKASLVRWRELLLVVGFRRLGDWFATVLWSYFFYKSKVTPSQVQELEMNVDPETARGFISTAEQLIAKGEARGKAEGKTEGKVELVLRCLEARFGPLTESVVARTRCTDPAELDELAVRILGATSIDAVFARE